MEVSSSHQLYVFFLSVASGIACGTLFDLQRSLRRRFFAGRLRTMAEDILFVVVALCIVLFPGYFSDSGQIRYYQVLGCVSGALFYGAFLSSPIMKILEVIYRIFEKILVKPVVKILTLLYVPIRKSARALQKLISRAILYVGRIKREVKKRKKYLKKRVKML